MKKIVKSFLISFLSIALAVPGLCAHYLSSGNAGMAAKAMCSCVFVCGRWPESVIQQELQVFPGLAQINMGVNNQDSTVTAGLFWQKTKAIYGVRWAVPFWLKLTNRSCERKSSMSIILFSPVRIPFAGRPAT